MIKKGLLTRKQQKRINALKHSEQTKMSPIRWGMPVSDERTKEAMRFDKMTAEEYDAHVDRLHNLVVEKLQVGQSGEIERGVVAYRGF